MVALRRAVKLTFLFTGDAYETLPEATCTVSGTGLTPRSSDAVKNDA